NRARSRSKVRRISGCQTHIPSLPSNPQGGISVSIHTIRVPDRSRTQRITPLPFTHPRCSISKRSGGSQRATRIGSMVESHPSRIMVVATGGAGGDLQPLIAAALALREQGHETPFAGDGSVQRSLRDLGVTVELLPPELDLGPRLAGSIREAMATTSGDLAAAG